MKFIKVQVSMKEMAQTQDKELEQYYYMYS